MCADTLGGGYGTGLDGDTVLAEYNSNLYPDWEYINRVLNSRKKTAKIRLDGINELKVITAKKLCNLRNIILTKLGDTTSNESTVLIKNNIELYNLAQMIILDVPNNSETLYLNLSSDSKLVYVTRHVPKKAWYDIFGASSSKIELRYPENNSVQQSDVLDGNGIKVGRNAISDVPKVGGCGNQNHATSSYDCGVNLRMAFIIIMVLLIITLIAFIIGGSRMLDSNSTTKKSCPMMNSRRRYQ